MLVEFKQDVVGVISGHTHTDEFRVLLDAHRTATIPYFIAPSLPPYNPDTNPAVRLFKTATSHQIIDFSQWTMDLSASNRVGKPVWSQYSALQQYGLADLSAQSLAALADRLWNDDDLFQVYNQAFQSFPSVPAAACTDAWSSSVYSPQGGGGRCKATLLCPILLYDDQSYFDCLAAHNQTTLPMI